jgi:murein DD-endopeptidase MepM/ murein hydrolase activator NlpD
MKLKIKPSISSMPLRRAFALQGLLTAALALAWWRGEPQPAPPAIARFHDSTPAPPVVAPAVSEADAPRFATSDVVVGHNDTLDRIFRRLELSLADLASLRALPELRQHLDRLYPGELLRFVFRGGEFFGIERKLSPSETLTVQRNADGFSSVVIENPIERETRISHGVIRSSLFEAADAAGISDATALAIAEIFAWDIDFVLDIRNGDSFTVTHEVLSQDGEYLGDGNILAVRFVNDGRSYEAVRFEPDGGKAQYYTPEGHSLKKAFLRTPVQFSRISSRFNPSRRHPVLNTIRAHRGVDYAAPTGTPVRAAGSGRVRFAGRKGGYGNVIELEHGQSIVTVYGHLSRFARGVRAGTRVEQGEVIGQVGMTGLATGPHLHYEYRLRGVHKNPQTVALPNAEPIQAAQRDEFLARSLPLLASLMPQPTVLFVSR